MKKLLFGLVLLVTSGLQAAESQALQDERAGQQNSSQAIKKFTRQEVAIKKEDNGSVSLRFVASKNKIVVPADLVGQCSYLKDMFEIFAQDTKEETARLNLTAEAVNLLIDLWGKAKTVEAFIQELPKYSFAHLIDLWMAIETLDFEYNSKQSVQNLLKEKIRSDFLRLIEQPEPLDPIIVAKIQVTMLRPYLTEQLYKNSWILKNTLQGHAHWANSVAFSPDGSMVATGSYGRTAKLWDMQTGQCLHTLKGHTKFVNSVAFSPDGQLILTGSDDGMAKLWDVQTGQCLRTLQVHIAAVKSVAFSPDGQLIATGSNDHTAKVWNVQTGQCLHTFEDHTAAVRSVAFSPDGSIVVTGSHDRTAKLWDVQTGECLHTLEEHTNIVNSVAFSSDGQLVATASNDRTAKVWDVKTGKCLHTLQGHNGMVTSVAFSPDGSMVVTGFSDRIAKLWNIQTGQLLHTLQGHNRMVNSVAFSPDGSMVVTSSDDYTLKIWINNFLKAGVRNLEQALKLPIQDVLHIFKTGQMPVKKIPAAESKPK